ncbi:DUF2249 domain-containing protein [Rhodococcus sp. D2-41]|uniref:DUF2249 domain-containing protein n=1 Tax=Speluncibacter jeojiensis TaxID=2710754 RepID=A0A9X4M1X9_9ACTN|nr:DUF2249 domain-containing protein [Rhodococcus sp. D2-41]MDG3008877.1 DUF2249 domain-containing protein [Rhodococcus sp. D2-41]MDG3016498.1 DUF2249 domain-containing protein [Corynebacteriales bacterium D3-21]
MATSEVVMATTAEDAAALEDLRARHAEINGRLAALVESLIGAAGASLSAVHRDGADFVASTLLPLLAAENGELYAPARASGRTRLFADAALAAVTLLEVEADRFLRAEDQARAIAAAEGLRVLVAARFAAADELLVPAVAADPATSLAELVAKLPESGSGASGEVNGGAGHGHGGCSCGEHDDEVPELDVRTIPHAIRHATVFGAFDAVPSGGSMMLIAHHDPIPLLHQLQERSGGRLQVDYEERGPEAWRLRLSRV